MPLGCALWPRWQVTTAALAGITKTHGNNRQPGRIVKLVSVQLQPAAQAITTGIIPGNPGGVHPRSGCLADDQQPGTRARPQYRPRPQGQLRLAVATGTNLPQQVLQRDVRPRCFCIIQIIFILAGQKVYVICPAVA